MSNRHSLVQPTVMLIGLAMLLLAGPAWATSITTTIDGPDPATCGLVKTATTHYIPDAESPGLRGYTVDFAITGGVTFELADIIEGSAFDDFEDSPFYKQDNGDGTYTITAAIVGPTDGLLTGGDLFSVTLTTDAEGPVEFAILSYQLRDPDNEPFFADLSGAGFTIDCTAPAAVSGITAAPGHNTIEVSWTHDGLDTAHYAVFRGLWYDSVSEESTYPEYGRLATNVIPTRPTSYAEALAGTEWVLVEEVSAGTLACTDTWTTGDNRGIYDYEVFAIDLATNASLLATAGDRATNYWLGDVDPEVGDGNVNIQDINDLGNAFGTSDGQDSWNPFCDVGPTDDNSRLGIPQPDGSINFEDLMIFAMNFSVVSGAKAQPAPAGMVQLAWSQIAAERWALTLVDGSGLQGLRLRASLPPGALQDVTTGDLLTAQDTPTFLRNVGESLDLSLAVFGQALCGTGVLCEIESTVEISLPDLVITARGLDNSDLEVSFTQTTGVEVPRVFSLDANYPNPFNPQTTLSFALPQAEDVRLAVYSVDGRLVLVLVQEALQAGRHEAVWSGHDEAGRPVATGTYFAVIRAGDFHQVRKMSLVK